MDALRLALRCSPMPTYAYELRRGDEIVSTAQITLDEEVVVGQRITIGGDAGIVLSVLPAIGGREARFVVQLLLA